MSSKVKLLSALLLATALTGCGSSGTVTGSIPDWGGGNDGGGNDGGGNDGGGNDVSSNTNGHFMRYDVFGGENAVSDSKVATGNATVTVSEDGSTAKVEVSADGMNVPNSGVMPHFSSGDDYNLYSNDSTGSFLDLSEGENYQLGTYYGVDPDDGTDLIGYFVDGERTPTEQINASATYTGGASGDLITSDYDADGYVGDTMVGLAKLDLTVNGSNATVSGAITDLFVTVGEGGQNLPGQITLEDANVVDSAYAGSTTFDIPGATTSTSSYQGAFYGENAAETAGTFHTEGSIPMEEGMVDVNLIGGFGASKD